MTSTTDFKMLFFFPENLARRSTTIITQSSTYQSHNASRTNDGITFTKEDNCAHTDTNNNSKAWLQVDLGKEFSIRNVVIFYRDEGMM